MKYLTTYKIFESKFSDDFKQDIKDICLEITDGGKFIVGLYTSDKLGDYIAIGQKWIPYSAKIYDEFSFHEVSDVVLRLVDFLGNKFKKCEMLFIELPIRIRVDMTDSVDKIDQMGKIINIAIFLNTNIFESKSEPTSSKLKFTKQTKKKGAKTDVYNVSNGGKTIGQVKWSSRMRGYAFLPTKECEPEIKEFVKELMRKRRED